MSYSSGSAPCLRKPASLGHLEKAWPLFFQISFAFLPFPGSTIIFPCRCYSHSKLQLDPVSPPPQSAIWLLISKQDDTSSILNLWHLSFSPFLLGSLSSPLLSCPVSDPLFYLPQHCFCLPFLVPIWDRVSALDPGIALTSLSFCLVNAGVTGVQACTATLSQPLLKCTLVKPSSHHVENSLEAGSFSFLVFSLLCDLFTNS